MSYAVIEASAQDAAPIELYLFVTGEIRQAYTNAINEIVFGTDTYVPVQINRSGIEHTPEFMRGELTISCPVSLAIAGQFIGGSPSLPTEVRVYRRHLSDGAAETAQIWRGRVLSLRVRGVEAEIVCGQIYGSLQRIGLRGNYQVGCRHALYQPGCGVDKASYAYAGTSASVLGRTVLVPGASAQPDDWYPGGLFVWGEMSRTITRQSGDILELLAPVPGLLGGMPVTIYPGCDHSHAMCAARFNHDYFFGGFPWMPVKNPFSGDGIA